MRWVKVILRGIVVTVLMVICAVLFFVLVIMGDAPKSDYAPAETEVSTPLAGMPEEGLHFPAHALFEAEQYFSAPILRLSGASGLVLDEVVISEYKPAGVSETVREVCLTYTNGLDSVRVSSMTPEAALRSMPARGFVATSEQDWTLGVMDAVLMKSGDTLHLHAQQGHVVYQIEGEIDADTLKWTAQMVEL